MEGGGGTDILARRKDSFGLNYRPRSKETHVLNLNQLRVFYEAARTLNFSMAARTLNVTQPAVTTQIKAFQESCELKLFRKQGGRISLTDEGKTIFIYASKLFEQLRELELTVSDFQKLKQGHLRVTTTKTYARYLMPVLLADFHRAYPGVVIDLNEGVSLDITRSLLDHRNTFAIAAKIQEDTDILYRPLLYESVVLIVSPAHRFASRGEISFEELDGESIIMKESGSGTRKLVESWAADAGAKFNVIMQTSNMEFIKELVKRNQAVAFVVKSSVDADLETGSVVSVPVKGRALVLNICLAHLRDLELNSTAKAFLNFLGPLLKSTDRPTGAAALLEKLSELTHA